MRYLLTAVLIGSVLLVAAGCNSSTSSSLQPHIQTLYYGVYYGSTPKPEVKALLLPLTSSSTSFATLSSSSATGLNASYGLAVDQSGRVYAGNFGATPNTTVSVFTPPISSASSAAFILTLSGVTGAYAVAIDPQGNLWVCDTNTNHIDEYAGPFTGNATISPTISIPTLAKPEGIAFDPAGNLYVANEGVSSTSSISIQVFLKGSGFVNGQSPASGLKGVVQPEAIAIDRAGNVYAGSSGSGIARWNAANALTNGATPDVIDGTGMQPGMFPSELAFDAAGNLYDADCGTTAKLYMWPTATQAFTNTLAPSVSFADTDITTSNCLGAVAIF